MRLSMNTSHRKEQEDNQTLIWSDVRVTCIHYLLYKAETNPYICNCFLVHQPSSRLNLCPPIAHIRELSLGYIVKSMCNQHIRKHEQCSAS